MRKGLVFRLEGDWKNLANDGWRQVIPEFARDEEGNKYVRISGRDTVFQITGEEGDKMALECDDCHVPAIYARIEHEVYRGGMLSIGERARVEKMPYCPECEDRPSPHGNPIRLKKK